MKDCCFIPEADPNNWNDDGTPKISKIPTLYLDFVGTTVKAELVTWLELDNLNDSADDFFTYLGNYRCDDDPDVFYALFRENENFTKYCVELPEISAEE